MDLITHQHTTKVVPLLLCKPFSSTLKSALASEKNNISSATCCMHRHKDKYNVCFFRRARFTPWMDFSYRQRLLCLPSSASMHFLNGYLRKTCLCQTGISSDCLHWTTPELHCCTGRVSCSVGSVCDIRQRSFFSLAVVARE